MRLPFVPRDGLCRKCGRDAIGLDGEYLCDDCRIHRPSFDRGASVLRFDAEGRDLVNRFKFRDQLYLAPDLVDLLEGLVRIHFKVNEVDAIVPMPLTISHRFLRGYNQCEILAKMLAKRLDKPSIGLLKRVGSPKRQGRLSEDDRRKNVIGTFAVRSTRSFFDRAHSSTILLVDDIMTTGSTLSEAAKTLKAAGVKRVWTITLARSFRG